MKKLLAIVLLSGFLLQAPVQAHIPGLAVDVLRVIDGDTVLVDLDLGLDIRARKPIRLLCVNTPEAYGATREAGLKAKAATEAWIKASSPIVAELPPQPLDKYGRVLAVLRSAAGGTSLNRMLLDTANATLYLCTDESVL